MTFQNRFIESIRKNKLAEYEMRILVAVSGGPDSMALLHLLKKSGFYCEAAHINYKLRGEESEGDEKLVNDYCIANSIPFHTTSYDTTALAREKKISIQMAARQLRYEWLEGIRKELKLDLIATAHHSGDQAETVLLKLFRGAGPGGLGAVRMKNGNVIRPLLEFQKSELIQYVNDNHIPFRIDSSNLKTDYQRNFIRHNLLPEIKKINPGIEHTLSQFADIMQAHHRFLQHSIAELNCVYKNPVSGYIHIRTKLLSSVPGFEILLHELLQPYHVNAADIPEISRALDAPGKTFITPVYRITVGQDELIVSVKESSNETIVNISSLPFNIQTPWGIFHGNETELPVNINHPLHNILYADLDKIKMPLKLRTWNKGDQFYPAGMKGSKKLSDYFTDKKISVPEKLKIPLLFSGDELVWICNMRMDQRFVVTPETKRTLCITYIPGVSM